MPSHHPLIGSTAIDTPAPSPRRVGTLAQGLAEYALILALIAIVAIIALIFLGGQISSILSKAGGSI